MEAIPPIAWAAGATVLAVALLGLLARRLRGRGDVVVVVDYASPRSGCFDVRLARRRERRLRGEGDEPGEPPASSRLERNAIARETHFRGVPARSYFVQLSGRFERAAEGGGVRTERVALEEEIRVARGRTARVSFDLRPKLCAVEILVVRGGRPARTARVALDGDPTSLRLAREGVVRLDLGPGLHRILAGAEDCAAERSLEIEDLAPRRLEIDLDEPTGRVFTECRAAVEPFLRGDLSVAATALERAGQAERANLLAARFHRLRGASDEAAERFESAGRWIEAAELRAERGELDHAGELFERAGDLSRAAEMYNAGGDLIRAGCAYEEAGDLEAAAVCYREAGEKERVAAVLEKLGASFEAAVLAQELGDEGRAVRNFQQVPGQHPEYARCCRALADIFLGQGRHELAVQKADEAMTFARPERAPVETVLWYAKLLDDAGRLERALEVLERLRPRLTDPKPVEARILDLRQRISDARKADSATVPVAAAFGEGSRYQLLDEIGSGGMGVVYRARDRRLGREVALKRLPDKLEASPQAIDFFLREARAAAALNHPNIVTLYDVDQEGGAFFLTMELLHGRTLTQVLRKLGRLTPVAAARLGLQIAAGLGYAHGRRIVHRDIKTSNLFYTQENVVKIMDFGLAKMLEEVRRANTVIAGTPYYMAPEQSAGESVDHRADLYAFGVTLFELVTGRRPFHEGDVAYQHRHAPVPDPREIVPELPREFAELILALMAKRPDDRPCRAEDAAARLEPLARSIES